MSCAFPVGKEKGHIHKTNNAFIKANIDIFPQGGA